MFSTYVIAGILNNLDTLTLHYDSEWMKIRHKPSEYLRTLLKMGFLIELGVNLVRGRSTCVLSMPDMEPP